MGFKPSGYFLSDGKWRTMRRIVGSRERTQVYRTFPDGRASSRATPGPNNERAGISGGRLLSAVAFDPVKVLQEDGALEANRKLTA